MATKRRWKLTVEIAMADAKKYRTRESFGLEDGGSWHFLSQRGLLDKACAHMEGNIIWTKKKAFKAARRYKSRNKFKLGNSKAWQYCSREQIMDEACAHMGPNKTPGRKPKNKSIKSIKSIKETSC